MFYIILGLILAYFIAKSIGEAEEEAVEVNKRRNCPFKRGWLALSFLLLLPLGAYAQQPLPQDQLAQATAMVSTLYRQLNTAIQDGAQQEAARIKLQQEVEKLKAQIAEWQKKGTPPGVESMKDVPLPAQEGSK